MKANTVVATSHELILDEDERFEVTTKTKRSETIRVARVVAEQRQQDGEWILRANGARILKSGKLGANEKLDSWTYSNSFYRGAQVQLFAEMSPAVRKALHALGVTF